MTLNENLGILVLIVWMVITVCVVINIYTNAMEQGKVLTKKEETILTGILLLSAIMFILGLASSTGNVLG